MIEYVPAVGEVITCVFMGEYSTVTDTVHSFVYVVYVNLAPPRKYNMGYSVLCLKG